MTTLLKNAKYLLPDCVSWGEGDILLAGGRIAAVGALPQGAEADEVIDARGKLVIPGFINAHAHSYTGYLKGSIDCMPLDIYMLHAIAGGSSRSAREIYVSTMVEALEMLKSGTTSVVDHFSERPSLTTEGLHSAADAFDNLGMRANIATMFADRGFLDTIPLLPGELPDEVRDRPSGRAQSPEEYIAVVEQAYLDARERDGRVRVILGTDGPQRCSDHLLELTGELERKYEMGWQTHALEAKTQAVFAREQYGVGLIEHMRDMGLLNSRLSLVHAVWLSEREMELCAEYGVNIVHCPGSNLHLGSGIAPVGRYRELGVNVALGSDGGNCGGVAMPEQLRLAARLSRVTEPDYARWLTAADALKMDYSGGKRVLMRGSCGAISEGADADLVLLDADNCLWQPEGDLTCQLVYGESGANVDTVFVAGRKVLQGGRSTLVDEEALYAEAREYAARIRRDNAPKFEAVERQTPYLRGMYLREIERDWPEDRLVYRK